MTTLTKFTGPFSLSGAHHANIVGILEAAAVVCDLGTTAVAGFDR